MKLAVVNSMRDKMFDVDIPPAVVNAFAPLVFITHDIVWRAGQATEGNPYHAIDYKDFAKLAEQMYI